MSARTPLIRSADPGSGGPPRGCHTEGVQIVLTDIDEWMSGPATPRSVPRNERPYREVGHPGEADEVAAVIGFRCGDRATFVDGSHDRVDAGSVATL